MNERTGDRMKKQSDIETDHSAHSANTKWTKNEIQLPPKTESPIAITALNSHRFSLHPLPLDLSVLVTICEHSETNKKV